MALSKHGQLLDPVKSPYNFESYDSLMELNYMNRLETDDTVRAWMKRHTITIPWIDGQKHSRRYRPDPAVRFRAQSVIQHRRSRSETSRINLRT